MAAEKQIREKKTPHAPEDTPHPQLTPGDINHTTQQRKTKGVLQQVAKNLKSVYPNKKKHQPNTPQVTAGIHQDNKKHTTV